MAKYKLTKGHMSGGFAEGDIVTSEDLEKHGVGEERALGLGVLELIDGKAKPSPVPEQEPPAVVVEEVVPDKPVKK